MDIRAEINTSVAAYAEFVARAVELAQGRTIAAATVELKERLRANVRRQFGGYSNFPNTIQSERRSARETGHGPEGEVFSKAVVKRGGRAFDLFRVFETAGRVRASGGSFLVLNLTRGGSRRVTKRNLLHGARLIPLYRQRRGGLS